MSFDLPLPEQRKQSIALFFEAAQSYEKKDIILRAAATAKQPAYFYYLTPPPYKGRPPKIGWGQPSTDWPAASSNNISS